jgi:hypothetical protein
MMVKDEFEFQKSEVNMHSLTILNIPKSNQTSHAPPHKKQRHVATSANTFLRVHQMRATVKSMRKLLIIEVVVKSFVTSFLIIIEPIFLSLCNFIFLNKLPDCNPQVF